MSLAINPDKIRRVLLHDGWHDVDNEYSFAFDAYEFVAGDDDESGDIVMGGGSQPPLPSLGFSFSEAGGRQIAGPVTSILAVDYE